MAFDDLAKHMAARDGKKKVISASSDGNAILANAVMANAKFNRQRDLILGPLLLLFGLVASAGWVYMLRDGFDELSRLDGTRVWRISIGFLLIGPAALFVGGKKLVRGLRNKSIDDDGELSG